MCSGIVEFQDSRILEFQNVFWYCIFVEFYNCRKVECVPEFLNCRIVECVLNWRPKISSFFPSSAQMSKLCSFSGGLLVEMWRRFKAIDHPKGVIGLLGGCVVKPPRPRRVVQRRVVQERAPRNQQDPHRETSTTPCATGCCVVILQRA